MPDAPDARDLVTFAELQAKVVGARRKLKMADQAVAASAQAARRAALTAAELETLGDETPVYTAFGRAFLSEPKPSVQAALKDAAAEGEAAAAGQAKARAAAVSGVAGAEGELRELLASSPALAAAAAAGGGGWE